MHAMYICSLDDSDPVSLYDMVSLEDTSSFCQLCISFLSYLMLLNIFSHIERKCYSYNYIHYRNDNAIVELCVCLFQSEW